MILAHPRVKTRHEVGGFDAVAVGEGLVMIGDGWEGFGRLGGFGAGWTEVIISGASRGRETDWADYFTAGWGSLWRCWNADGFWVGWSLVKTRSLSRSVFRGRFSHSNLLRCSRLFDPGACGSWFPFPSRCNDGCRIRW